MKILIRDLVIILVFLVGLAWLFALKPINKTAPLKGDVAGFIVCSFLALVALVLLVIALIHYAVTA